MYELPLNFATKKVASKADVKGVVPRHRIPLHEHTAFLLACGVLHDDVDDRQDTFRGALEIDPLLAVWTVFAANKKNVRLTNMNSAVRWLASSFFDTLPSAHCLTSSKPLSVAGRAAWRNIATQAVGSARLARQAALSLCDSKSAPNDAGSKRAYPLKADANISFWMAMLCGAKRELDGLAKLNGKSPLHGFDFRWPKWLREFDRDLRKGKATGGVAACVHDALTATSSERESLVSKEERELWFRPYPEFRALVPLLFSKLRRLNEIEADFAETIQREKMASLQQLAYGASHEINNPLANISTRAQTLVYNEHDGERRKKLIAINKQAFRAYEMIADLMLFAKPPRIELSEVCVETMLEQIHDELAGEAVRSGISLRFMTNATMADSNGAMQNAGLRESNLGQSIGERLSCHGDREQLTNAIKAICVNGLETMGSGGVLTVQARKNRTTNCLVITIEDNGSGLSESAQRHLFDPFFSGREAGRGMGFGLSKAWRIIEQHRGRIDVSSYPQNGSRFTVTLPIEFAGASELQDASNDSGRQVDHDMADSPNSPSGSHDTINDASVSR